MHRSQRDSLIFSGIASALVFLPLARAARSDELPPGLPEAQSKDKAAVAPPVGARERAHLGILLAPKVPGDEKSGVVVTYVNPASAAKEMGFLPGDEVRVINDVIVTDVKSLIAEIQKQNAGSKQRFMLRRGGMDLKIEGRLSSVDKTMRSYQDIVRKNLVGKPFPELPPMLAWDTASGGWKETAGDLASFRGKHSVIFSFDDCPECKSKRYTVFSRMKTLLDRTAAAAPLAILGIYYNESKGKDQSLKAAEALFRESPPPFPATVAYYPADKPASPEDREKHALLHTHGTAIIGPDGTVKYIQTYGLPQEEFLRAYEQLLKEVGAAGGAESKAPSVAPARKGSS